MDYDDDERERDDEPEELPEVRLDQPGACCVCGKEECTNGCFRCGRPVHYHPDPRSYFSDSACGAWTLDTWHPGHPEGNEFYCNECLHAGLIEPPLTVGGLTFAYTDHKSVTVMIDGSQARELTTQETRDLVAYLHDQRGELFYHESKGAELESVTVASAGRQDDPGNLDDVTF